MHELNYSWTGYFIFIFIVKTNVVGDEISYVYSRWPPASKVCREVLERILKSEDWVAFWMLVW